MRTIRDEGWSQRRTVHSIVYHYIRDGRSVCDKQWQDIAGPLRLPLQPGMKPCPNCVLVLASRPILVGCQ